MAGVFAEVFDVGEVRVEYDTKVRDRHQEEMTKLQYVKSSDASNALL